MMMKKSNTNMANPEEEEEGEGRRNPWVNPHPFKKLKPSSPPLPPRPPPSNNPSIHPSPSPSPPSSSSSQHHPFPPSGHCCINDNPPTPYPSINPNTVINSMTSMNGSTLPSLAAPNLTSPPAQRAPKRSPPSPSNSNILDIPINTLFAESSLLPYFHQTITTTTSTSNSNPTDPLSRPSASAVPFNNNMPNSFAKKHPHNYTPAAPSVTPSTDLSKFSTHSHAFNLAPGSSLNLISSSATANYSFRIRSPNLPQSINPDSSSANYFANCPNQLRSSLKSNWSSSPPPPPLHPSPPLSLLLSHPLPATTSSSSSTINALETPHSPPGISYGHIQHQMVKQSCRKKGSLEFDIAMELNTQSSPPWVTVGMEGRSIGGRICLHDYDGYPSFARAIRQMFAGTSSCINIPNAVPEQDYTLENAVPSHIIAYEDIEGDLLLAGDLSWRDFVRVAKRIRILPSQRQRK